MKLRIGGPIYLTLSLPEAIEFKKLCSHIKEIETEVDFTFHGSDLEHLREAIKEIPSKNLSHDESGFRKRFLDITENC